MIRENTDYTIVKHFLSLARNEIRKGNFRLEPRKNIKVDGTAKNYKQCLFDLSITIEGVKEKIYSLKEEECYRISFDYDSSRDYNSEIFEFLTNVNNIITYIKLTINNVGLLCLSFHKSNG